MTIALLRQPNTKKCMKINLYNLWMPFLILFIALGAKAQIISTVAGNGTLGYSGNGGPALSASCDTPRDVDVDMYGNLYIADAGNNVIRKVSGNIMTTVAGNGTPGYSGDNGAAVSASLSKPSWVSVDYAGNLYIADIGNYVVRKVSTSGIITTIAGNHTLGNSGNGGKATSAELGWPFAVVPDNEGDIYISDYYNSCIWKVNSAGTISTLAGTGTGGYRGDGGHATLAELYNPAGMSLDASNNLYFADYSNNVIREVTAGGIIYTVAGNGTSADAGDGSPATAASFVNPISVAVDADENLFISDPGASRIRYVQSSSGNISTYAGNGTPGYTGNGYHSYAAEINNPAGSKVDRYGNFFFADQDNYVIRGISTGNIPINGVKPVTGSSNDMEIFPNPNTGIFSIKGKLNSLNDEKVSLEVTDMLGQAVYKNTTTASAGSINLQITLDNILPNGVYLLHIISCDGANVLRFVVEK